MMENIRGILAILISVAVATPVIILITYLMGKIRPILVFLLPVALSVFSLFFTVFIFSGEAGFGVIFLLGFWIIGLAVTLAAWIISLVFFFKWR